jgi:hypothetical protein
VAAPAGLGEPIKAPPEFAEVVRAALLNRHPWCFTRVGVFFFCKIKVSLRSMAPEPAQRNVRITSLRVS